MTNSVASWMSRLSRRAIRRVDGRATKPDERSSRLSELQIYCGYADEDLAIFDEFTAPNRKSEPGFVVDFLGARTRVSSLYNAVHALNGNVQGPPIPGDYHAEAVEWLGLLKSVKTARKQYIAAEWGAGWGPWLVAGAAAARRKRIDNIRLYGVEADPNHFAAMRQHFIDNNLPPEEHILLMAAVGATAGQARWPKHPDPRNDWGSRPARIGAEGTIDEDDAGYLGKLVENFMDVEILAADELLSREKIWDLLHIDIQGWEGEVCRSCRKLISERVRWTIIGVHSRLLDAELLQLFYEEGWILEHEKPTRFRYDANKANFDAMVIADGTQVWRNPRLT